MLSRHLTQPICIKTMMAYIVVTCKVREKTGESIKRTCACPCGFQPCFSLAAPVLPCSRLAGRGEPFQPFRWAQRLLAEPPAAFLWVGGRIHFLYSRKHCCSRQLERPPGLWDLSCKRNVCNKFSLRAGSAVILVKEKEMLSE